NRERGTGNGERGTGNREQGTGNGEQGTGYRSRRASGPFQTQQVSRNDLPLSVPRFRQPGPDDLPFPVPRSRSYPRQPLTPASSGYRASPAARRSPVP